MRESYILALANLMNGSLLGYENKCSIPEYKKDVEDYVQFLEKEVENLNNYKTLYKSARKRNNRAIDILKNHNTELVLIEENGITINFERIYNVLIGDEDE